MKKIYPAVFSEEEAGGYYIQFPDLEGNGTQGDTLEEGLDFASDYLGIVLSDLVEHNESLPKPSNIKDISVKDDEFVTLIEVDLSEYIQDNRLSRTNTNIPVWLKTRAEKQGINFSKLLTEALMNKLEV
ncbi:type II toxin-antitoxin system HicB family antitoxin [Vagococcus xieshaowenii]|uniref:Type II toxin-antitoxin system HicB family antitoxin n=1 Tax=Vagococcus xieshaowenii TaxID=2562451 RepID=A0AAJ5JMA9_9ENTE|nr:type II toxin-antitoxin system HicB family antitoxin [Vagococcus xieshaowenii]QCA29699.1 type II toxin-antitoxin system HicB family antitoxin [Vagococcus xieshaowenii]TFZ42914.1 type II toxin-antitoxin system HicB family antitoxin [Vagococcus xieshaowenii]